MISAKFDDTKFFKEMNNIVKYSEGFLEGVKKGKSEFAVSLAKNAIQIFKEFVDQQARVSPQMYHHIYEWYMEGSPTARLFDINCIVVDGGLTFNGTFSQSISIKSGSTTPFYNKAEIMEKGLPITIKTKRAQVLKFNADGEEIFTSKPIVVENPGGTTVAGSFERVFDLFFKEHFRQSVIEITGIRKYLQEPTSYGANLQSGKTNGKAKGIQVGYNWIVNAGELND